MPCLPGYRYCGPGCSGPGAPTNQLDFYCMQHDACYRKNKLNKHKHCDQLFLKQLEPFTRHPGKIGKDARFMYRIMKLKQGLI
ncbi:Parvovirus coat protein VP1-like protein [Oceanobacillus senegalensis]|uniref:Parvovirus coat protein VP1-like protein n=1 Tax=Oceanobacillus senegalensis TaxID=1936063 RepID=UPI000A30C9D1|nr:Parvovirus coat protein VP1-like protein [Oceanobacillus senegalensis]